jgi:hypothetical protein
MAPGVQLAARDALSFALASAVSTAVLNNGFERVVQQKLVLLKSVGQIDDAQRVRGREDIVGVHDIARPRRAVAAIYPGVSNPRTEPAGNATS